MDMERTTTKAINVAREDDELRTLDDLDVEGRRLLLRADFDVPLTHAAAGVRARVADDTRIRAALPTIDELRRRGARLVLVSHLGRPRGPAPALSMRPVADRLAKLTGAPVPLAPGAIGQGVRDLTERLEPGQMLMLENIRFESGELRNDPALASALAELADVYVGDSFAGAQHAHASTWGVAHRLPSAAGLLMEREVHALRAIIERPARPLVVILGGARLRDKIGVARRFLELADVVCIGGAICFPFLAAVGHSFGSPPCPRGDLERAGMVLRAAGSARHRLALPDDLLFTTSESIGWRGVDIGANTAARYATQIAAAATVLWSGPMGSAELPHFGAGTRTIADAVASTSAMTVAGGRETVQALRHFGLEDQVSHVSADGDAMLMFLEGRELPGVRVLLRNGRQPRR
jgi:phosphoglycerate kinase